MVNEFHTSVLINEVVHYLCTEHDGLYVDCTVGGGGHAVHILQHASPSSRLLGIDRDNEALNIAKQNLAPFGNRVLTIQANFAELQNYLKNSTENQVCGLLLDLGVSSYQINTINRGFSFQAESRLDMRMDPHQQLDAWSVVNRYDEKELADILWQYGEERFSRAIAKRIVKKRSEQAIESTVELAHVVESVVGQRALTKSLARVFQAIRIEVNNELENLKQVLRDAIEFLVPGGRMVVISYHSLEDRIVKQFFREESLGYKSTDVKHLMFAAIPRVKILTKKPVVPTDDEIRHNPRARSAKLRAAERL